MVDLASDIGASLAVSDALKQRGLNVGSKEARDALEAFAKAMGKEFLEKQTPKQTASIDARGEVSVRSDWPDGTEVILRISMSKGIKEDEDAG